MAATLGKPAPAREPPEVISFSTRKYKPRAIPHICTKTKDLICSNSISADAIHLLHFKKCKLIWLFTQANLQNGIDDIRLFDFTANVTKENQMDTADEITVLDAAWRVLDARGPAVGPLARSIGQAAQASIGALLDILAGCIPDDEEDDVGAAEA